VAFFERTASGKSHEEQDTDVTGRHIALHPELQHFRRVVKYRRTGEKTTDSQMKQTERQINA